MVVLERLGAVIVDPVRFPDYVHAMKEPIFPLIRNLDRHEAVFTLGKLQQRLTYLYDLVEQRAIDRQFREVQSVEYARTNKNDDHVILVAVSCTSSPCPSAPAAVFSRALALYCAR